MFTVGSNAPASSLRASGAERGPSGWKKLARNRGLRALRWPRFTREGRFFVLFVLLVGLAALYSGNNLLFLVLGMMLSLIVVSGIMCDLALEGLEFRRRLPRRAFAGLPVTVEIEVRNTKKRFPSYSIEVEDRLYERRTDKRCYFLKISAGARQAAQYRRTPPIRGMERYLGLRVATRFPFGLMEKWRDLDLVDEQLVYPSPLRFVVTRPATERPGGTDATTGRGFGDVDGVREPTSGEPSRDVHWAKTAARGSIVVRDRHRETARRVRVDLTNTLESAKDREQLELDIRRTAWAVLAALKSGIGVDLVAADGGDASAVVFHAVPGRGATDRVLAFLARLPPVPRSPEYD